MSFLWWYVVFFLWVVNSTSSVSSLLSNSLVDFSETLVILSAILLPIKSLVASAVFWIALFEAVFIASVADFLVVSIIYWLYLLLKFLPMFLTKDKNPYPFTYTLSLGSIECLIFITFIYLITTVRFILSSISDGLLFWLVNHSLISLNSELNVCKKIWFVGEISKRLANALFGTNVYNTLESCW